MRVLLGKAVLVFEFFLSQPASDAHIDKGGRSGSVAVSKRLQAHQAALAVLHQRQLGTRRVARRLENPFGIILGHAGVAQPHGSDYR